MPPPFSFACEFSLRRPEGREPDTERLLAQLRGIFLEADFAIPLAGPRGFSFVSLSRLPIRGADWSNPVRPLMVKQGRVTIEVEPAAVSVTLSAQIEPAVAVSYLAVGVLLGLLFRSGTVAGQLVAAGVAILLVAGPWIVLRGITRRWLAQLCARLDDGEAVVESR
jgi:hypothetical protein